MQNTT